MRPAPMHPRPFQPGFDHQLIATFDGPAANRPPLVAKLGILQLGLAFPQVGQVGSDLGGLGMLLGQLLQLGEDRFGSFCFELVEAFSQPILGLWGVLSIQRLSHLAEM